MKTCK